MTCSGFCELAALSRNASRRPRSFPDARIGTSSNTDLARDCRFQKALNLFDRNPVDDWPEEPFDDQVLGFGPWQSARLQIEKMLLLDLGDRRPVCAAHVVGGDLQIWNRIGASRPVEDEVAILLVGVGLLRPLFDLDQS